MFVERTVINAAERAQMSGQGDGRVWVRSCENLDGYNEEEERWRRVVERGRRGGDREAGLHYGV